MPIAFYIVFVEKMPETITKFPSGFFSYIRKLLEKPCWLNVREIILL